MYLTCNLMKNLLSYCGLVDAKIRATDKYSPVTGLQQQLEHEGIFQEKFGNF